MSPLSSYLIVPNNPLINHQRRETKTKPMSWIILTNASVITLKGVIQSTNLTAMQHMIQQHTTTKPKARTTLNNASLITFKGVSLYPNLAGMQHIGLKGDIRFNNS